MKKILYIVIIALLVFLFACQDKNNVKQDDDTKDEKISEKYGEIDIDLASMSGTIAYSQVYDMINSPEKYEGKVVKMRGQFSAFYSKTTKLYYPAVIIQDATACCSKGIEFVLDGNPDYPAAYPKTGKTVTVVGIFEIYYENGDRYCHLVNAIVL
ncbi:MAG: hypothetical protein K6E74_00095 [Bacilli bacterium]|nr:hypothetical protein [Bacilli bacterium]